MLEYGTGQAGTEGAFAEKFDAAMKQIRAVADELPHRPVVTAEARPAPARSKEQPASPAMQVDGRIRAGWDVFDRDRSRSLLVYSK